MRARRVPRGSARSGRDSAAAPAWSRLGRAVSLAGSGAGPAGAAQARRAERGAGGAAPRLGGWRWGCAEPPPLPPAAAVSAGGGGCRYVSPALWERGRGGPVSGEPLSGDKSRRCVRCSVVPFQLSSLREPLSIKRVPLLERKHSALSPTLLGRWDVAALGAAERLRLVGSSDLPHQPRERAAGGCRLLLRACLDRVKKCCWVCGEKLPASDGWVCSAIVCNILLTLLLV